MKKKFFDIFFAFFIVWGAICATNALAKADFSYYDNVFLKIKKDASKYEKDSFLLFDCLYDKDAESIDAYSLFLHIKEKGYKAYYITLKDSDIYKKLKDENNLENIIVISEYSRNDGKKFITEIAKILPRTKAIITSFGTESVIDKYFHSLDYLKYIFIQHGQTFFKESVLNSGYLFEKKFPYILASSDIESAIFKKYGWKDKNILKAGLPRWDLLKNNNLSNNEKSIFIMFTWRITNPKRFAHSLYLKRLSSLLGNKEFHNFLQKNNIKVYLAIHHALKANSNINLNIDLDNIEVVDTKKISHYIKKSSLLITDLSSVCFDFMFQNKPVIFYGLDRGDGLLERNQFIDLELLKRRENVIPNIVFDEKLLIEKVKYYVNRDFVLEDNTANIYSKFFYLKENIREKLFDEINRVINN